MAAVRDGAIERLGTLFDRHARALHEFFSRRTHVATVADDLVQETFLRVLKYRKSWRGHGSFAGWLYRLAVNVDRHRQLRAAGQLTAVGSATNCGPQVDRSGSPLSELERAEAVARLHAAISRLSPAQRALIALRWFDELTAEQIGEQLRCTAGAVRVRLHRAHARLRELDARERGEVDEEPS